MSVCISAITRLFFEKFLKRQSILTLHPYLSRNMFYADEVTIEPAMILRLQPFHFFGWILRKAKKHCAKSLIMAIVSWIIFMFSNKNNRNTLLFSFAAKNKNSLFNTHNKNTRLAQCVACIQTRIADHCTYFSFLPFLLNIRTTEDFLSHRKIFSFSLPREITKCSLK